MKLTKGTILKARGGWDAEVVWISNSAGFYVVHKQGEHQESPPIWHSYDGIAGIMLGVNEPPSFNGHPADLEMGEYEL